MRCSRVFWRFINAFVVEEICPKGDYMSIHTERNDYYEMEVLTRLISAMSGLMNLPQLLVEQRISIHQAKCIIWALEEVLKNSGN